MHIFSDITLQMKQMVNPVHLYYKITIGYTNRLCELPVR